MALSNYKIIIRDSKYVLFLLHIRFLVLFFLFGFERMHWMRSAIYRQLGERVQLDLDVVWFMEKQAFHVRPKHLVNPFYISCAHRAFKI